MQVRTRIAPSPTGYPHIGTLFQALINYIYAQGHDGKFLVRIEDTDRSRLVEDAEDKLFEALEWFGLIPDESTRHDGDFGPYRQSERLDAYKKYSQQLIDAGRAYYCFCSRERLDEVRKDKQKAGKPPMYDQHCRNLGPVEAKKRSTTESHVVRMKIPANETIIVHDAIRGEIEFDSNIVDDQVIIKSDGFPTYHLAVVVDDHLMEISHIVRGEEWISSAPKHVLLYQYFDWTIPVLIHTPILRNPDKSKLSKRHGHASVSWYIENGYIKEAVLNFLITRVWNHPEGREVFDIKEMANHFEFEDMHIQGPIADLDKLNWLNGLYIRTFSDKELLERLATFIPSDCSPELASQILPLIKERLVTLSEFEELTSYFYRDIELDPKDLLKKGGTPELVTAEKLATKEALTNLNDWNHEVIEEAIRKLSIDQDWKPKQYFMMLRIAITGQKATPPLFETMEVLGKDLTLARLS